MPAAFLAACSEASPVATAPKIELAHDSPDFTACAVPTAPLTERLTVKENQHFTLSNKVTSIRIRSGKAWISYLGKDMVLKLCSMLPMESCDYRVIEYQGEAIHALPMGERLTLTNMSPELGAKTSVIAPDDITMRYLESVGVHITDADHWQSDPAAQYEQCVKLDATSLEPQISAPGSPSHPSPTR